MLIPRPLMLTSAGGAVPLTGRPVRREPDDPGLGPEGYRLDITPEGVRLTGGGPAGRFYGLRTLDQLGPRAPRLTVEDRPRFAWRGVMLDVARHFMPKDFVLRLIDLLALHKLNVLHLHLTDDQGWRLEIKRYPLLTEVGARRGGGFYTHEDVREILAYAAERFVTVVPEIEMPGHAQAAVAAYPRLGNQPERRLDVWDGWGISEHVLNLEEPTIRFCQDVLDEVVDLFPGPYVHVGGDECPTREWERSPAARRRIAELGLPGPAAARAWFIGRMAAHLAERGRRLVCWDEGDDVSPDAVLMAWRDAEPGPRAGAEVVLAPHRHTYFDYYPSGEPGQPPAQEGVVSLADAYHFAPPARRGVLGVQCQLWTEYMPTPEHVEYMAFPRLCAFAEVAWGSAGDFPDFLTRLPAHLDRLAALGVNLGPVRT
ncbi:beta-N-acetylhexosaminidase [Microtetraspora sp. NBRC 13810]|uniref:beta-N-acetylhexosaminidase n=1 Tax=Microtetraspora sp. NBRC 13810 TaxID=3030990 RepID=UPI0024A0D3D0|nr:beta-N-acetylhexosaminidase [Microtetraspora sp. NBRC 13810]GLW07998.1 beta-N-acetylhexosaminidase [Microtetraspora sp. NBRC 13810]